MSLGERMVELDGFFTLANCKYNRGQIVLFDETSEGQLHIGKRGRG